MKTFSGKFKTAEILIFLCVLLFLSQRPQVAAESVEDGWLAGKAGRSVGIDAASMYLHYCSQCHGIGGKGDGINSTPDMAINPRDHTEASFMSTRSDEQFTEIITGGGTRLAKSPLMPPWGSTLSKEEVSALVAYLRELCKCKYEGILSHNKLRRVDPDFK